MKISYSWDAIQAHVARRISEVIEIEVSVADFSPPPDAQLGDIAFGCFKAAKALGKSPVDIAKQIQEKLGKNDHTIVSATAAGPYVNILLSPGDLIARIVHDVDRMKKEFGMSEAGGGASILLEYAQPNTHKEIHIGHLRNLLIGSSLVQILQQAHWKVIPVSYHGDVGAHVAKCLWFLVRLQAHVIPHPVPTKKKTKSAKKEEVTKEYSPEEWIEVILASMDDAKADAILLSVAKKDRTSRYLGKMYSESTKLLEENPEWKAQVSEVQRYLEAHAAGWEKLWAETRRWSIDDMGTVFQELGVKLDRQYFESEVMDEGQRMVDQLLAKHIAKESQGAIIVDLEEKKLGTLVVRKSDGTSLYSTKDLALATKKATEYPAVSRSLHIVDVRQEFYFKQLFCILGLMGYRMPLEYVGYEIVTLTTGAMSSRQGNIVTWESLRDEVMSHAVKETMKRHPEWVEGRVTHTAWCLAMGGMKFAMLKQDSDKIFTFDIDRALSFEGDTGPYIQYAATRLSGILRKAGWKASQDVEEVGSPVLSEPSEKRLAVHIAAFPGVCRKAAEELRPAVLAQWCVSMASRINEFYRDVNVQTSPDEQRIARLQLVAASHTVLARALELLGIPLPDEM